MACSILACSILCCLIVKRSLSRFDREGDPLKEEELLTLNRLCLLLCQTVSNTFKKSLKFLTKPDIPLSFSCSFPLFKCFFTLILSCEIVSIAQVTRTNYSSNLDYLSNLNLMKVRDCGCLLT